MKQQYIPLKKRSKRQKKEYYKAQHKDWSGLNQVTQRSPNPRAYNRKKSGQWNDYDPCPDFLIVS